MKPQQQTRRAKQLPTADTASLSAALPGVMMFAMTAEIPWVAEVNTIQIGVEEALIYNSGPNDPLDPDEPIREVVQLPYHGGIVIIVTDRSVYVMDQATFRTSTCDKRPQRGM